MNLPLDEKKLLEMLAVFQSAEQGARDICQMSTEIALKYQSRMRQVRAARQQQIDSTN